MAPAIGATSPNNFFSDCPVKIRNKFSSNIAVKVIEKVKDARCKLSRFRSKKKRKNVRAQARYMKRKSNLGIIQKRCGNKTP